MTAKPKRASLMSDIRIDAEAYSKLSERAASIRKPNQWHGVPQGVIISRALAYYFARVKKEPAQDE